MCSCGPGLIPFSPLCFPGCPQSPYSTLPATHHSDLNPPAATDQQPATPLSPTFVGAAGEGGAVQAQGWAGGVHDKLCSLETENSALQLQVMEPEEVHCQSSLASRRSMRQSRYMCEERWRHSSQAHQAADRAGQVQLLLNYAKKESNLNGAQLKLREHEAALNSKDAALTTALVTDKV